MLDDLGLADFQQPRRLLGLRAGARAARVADGDRAVVVIGHGPEHVHEFLLVLGLHVDDVRDVPEVADVEKAVVGRAVVAAQSGAVHAEGDIEVLQRHVVDDHVIGALHESRIDGQERLEPLHGEAAGEKRGVFLGDADVEILVGMFRGKMDSGRCRWASRR